MYQPMRRVAIPRRVPSLSNISSFVPPVRPPLGAHNSPQPWASTPLTPWHILTLPTSHSLLPWTPYPTALHQGSANTPVWPPQACTPASFAVCITPAVPQDAVCWTPGTFPPTPLGVGAPLLIHPNLIYNPNNPSIPRLHWDIIHPPEMAKVYTGRHNIVAADLKEIAVVPGVKKVYISSDHPLLKLWMDRWGPIIVEKFPRYGEIEVEAIMIRDILDAIYEYFQKPLTRRDYREIERNPENKSRLTYSAHQRVKDSCDLPAVGLSSGFRRVDVFGGHRRFQGLRPVVFQDGTWKLFLGLLPGPIAHDNSSLMTM